MEEDGGIVGGVKAQKEIKLFERGSKNTTKSEPRLQHQQIVFKRFGFCSQDSTEA